jgi:hypothetical protein
MPCKDAATASEDEAVPNSSARRVQAGRRRGRWSEVTALKPCVVRETGWLTGGAGLSAMRRHERARVRVWQNLPSYWAHMHLYLS